MKTVSTLCATSTVGVAACGYALARPHYHIDSQRTNSQARVAAENLLCAARAAPEPESIEPSLSPAVPFALNRPSTARRWLRRMSESLTSSSGSPSSLISSSTGSSSQSRPRSSTNFQPCSRFSGRNKLVKRSLSQRRPSTGYANSTLDSTSFDHARRPFTAVNHSQLSAQRPWSRIGRSSTSERIPSSFSPSASEATVVWRPFFPTKHQSKGHRLSAPKSSKLSTVRRIFLENVRGRRCGPTLVSATAIRECCDNDTSSICSDSGSVYMLAEPDSGYYTREILVRGWHQPATSVTPTSSRSSIRRSFSLSTFLSSTPSQRNSYQAAERNDGGLVNTLPGIHSINIGLGRRYSSPIEYSMSPYGRYMRAPTPTIDEEREPLPPIQSLSMLELQPELGNAFLTDTEDWLGHNLSTFQPTASASENTNTFHQNRLSLMSASERASTLIGSESEHDYGSETVFDSMRTRISELTPVRVEDIFDIEEIPTKRVVERAQEQSSYSSAIPAAAYRTFASTRVEDDNDSWNSDWDAPSKSTDEEGCRLSGFGGLRPYSGLLSASHLGLHSHSNTSSTSFGTAPEAYSTDGASTRETNSILDWNDGVSTTPTPSCFNFQRPKTVHAKESVLVPTRAGRRAPSYHVRSQSVPVTNNLRGRVPLASENWDDDFLDDNGDGIGFVSEMVIPRAIEERQESVIGHLGCVREFALLVEDLKGLRTLAFSRNLRHGSHQWLWDEADGIIALASVDNEDDSLLRRDSFHRQSTWTYTNPEPSINTMHEGNKLSANWNRRSSVLPLDDDIFGNHPVTPVSTHAKSSAQGSPTALAEVPPRAAFNKSDPVELAKSIMAKMQQRQRIDPFIVAGSDAADEGEGKVQFDTDMLRELVRHVSQLKESLTGLLDGIPPVNSQEKLPNVVAKLTETSLDKLDIPPAKPSLEDGFRNGMDVVGMEFRPVVEITS